MLIGFPRIIAFSPILRTWLMFLHVSFHFVQPTLTSFPEQSVLDGEGTASSSTVPGETSGSATVPSLTSMASIVETAVQAKSSPVDSAEETPATAADPLVAADSDNISPPPGDGVDPLSKPPTSTLTSTTESPLVPDPSKAAVSTVSQVPGSKDSESITTSVTVLNGSIMSVKPHGSDCSQNEGGVSSSSSLVEDKASVSTQTSIPKSNSDESVFSRSTSSRYTSEDVFETPTNRLPSLPSTESSAGSSPSARAPADSVGSPSGNLEKGQANSSRSSSTGEPPDSAKLHSDEAGSTSSRFVVEDVASPIPPSSETNSISPHSSAVPASDPVTELQAGSPAQSSNQDVAASAAGSVTPPQTKQPAADDTSHRFTVESVASDQLAQPNDDDPAVNVAGLSRFAVEDVKSDPCSSENPLEPYSLAHLRISNPLTDSQVSFVSSISSTGEATPHTEALPASSVAAQSASSQVLSGTMSNVLSSGNALAADEVASGDFDRQSSAEAGSCDPVLHQSQPPTAAPVKCIGSTRPVLSALTTAQAQYLSMVPANAREQSPLANTEASRVSSHAPSDGSSTYSGVPPDPLLAGSGLGAPLLPAASAGWPQNTYGEAPTRGVVS